MYFPRRPRFDSSQNLFLSDVSAEKRWTCIASSSAGLVPPSNRDCQPNWDERRVICYKNLRVMVCCNACRATKEFGMLNIGQLRNLNNNDLPAAMELSTLAGWNQTADDWRMLLELAPDGC